MDAAKQLKTLNTYCAQRKELPLALQSLFPSDNMWRISSENFADTEFVSVMLPRWAWELALAALRKQLGKAEYQVILDAADWIDTDAETVADELNQELKGDREEPNLYSYAQARKAIMQFLNDEMEALAEHAAERFLAKPSARRARYLGDPEESKEQLARDEHADMLCDMARGN